MVLVLQGPLLALFPPWWNALPTVLIWIWGISFPFPTDKFYSLPRLKHHWYKTEAAQKINLISRPNPKIKNKTVTGVQTWRWAPACVKTPFSGGENSPVQSFQTDLYFSPFLCQQTWRNLHPDLSKSQFSRAPRYKNPSASTRGCVDVGGNLRVSPWSTLLRKFKIPSCCGWGLEDLLQAI